MNSVRIWRSRLHLLGTARLRLALLVAAFVATAFTLLTSLPAHAAPSPTPDPTATATTPPSLPLSPLPPSGGLQQQTPTPEELQQIQDLLDEFNKHVSKAMQEAFMQAEQERIRLLLPDEGGVLSVFNVTDRGGMPISAYTVRSDTGGLTDWDLGIYNLIAELCFMITKWVIAFCCWLIARALSFALAKLLLTPALSVANSLHTRVILEMGLPSLAMAVCALVCVARIFFGDRAKGWGDAALSLLIAALTTTLLASPPQVLLGSEDGAVSVARGLSLEVARIILDASPTALPAPRKDGDEADSESLARPLTDSLTDAFIVKPAMLIQYGRVFEGECATKYSQTKLSQLAYDRAITEQTAKLKKYNHLRSYIDPTGAALTDWTTPIVQRWAVDHFGNPPMQEFEKECVKGDIGTAKKASLDKAISALFLLVAALIVSVLISGLTGSFLVAQCRIAWDAIRAEPALVLGTIPGAGRAYLWDWAASVLRSLGQMIASVIALATFIVIVQAVLDPTQTDWGKELTLRFLIVDLICIGAVMKRRKIMARSKQVSQNLRTKLSTNRIGGTHGSVFTPPSSTPITKQPRVAQSTARVLVRAGLVGVSLASGNPLAAMAYAMPQSVGASVLATRLGSPGRGGRSGPARPAARPAGRPRPTGGTGPSTGPAPRSSRPTPVPTPNPPTAPAPAPGATPSSVPPPRPSHRPGAHPARRPHPAPTAAAAAARPAVAPRHPVPTQAAASPRQRQLRHRLDRNVRRTPPPGRGPA
ncbi:hypothetical protein OTB20_33330 [Streptomyces sp. H27-H1]|uniref:hypothetical protein n=1 Tax=Streptomyces sp. H27-H1 TaxID=2996461 RepID=UPI00226EE264|nr:hypothetical protein [Streptomyces sp. H27-H1]MCY0930991.1 hypothetical protein [Streptomyces sp. H27-H1]